MSAFELLLKVAFKLLTWQFLQTVSFPNPELALRIQWDRSLRTPVAPVTRGPNQSSGGRQRLTRARQKGPGGTLRLWAQNCTSQGKSPHWTFLCCG